MPTIRHPFASIQYVRNSLSTDALTGWRRGEYQHTVPGEIPPVPPLPPQVRNEPTRRASPRLPHPSSFLRPSLNIDVPIMSSRSSPGHFVKHSSKITLLLSGQEEGTKEPEYTSGSTIDGILAVPRPSGLLSLQVLVEGTLKLKEIAGSGSYESDILRDSLFTWDSERNASFPSKVTFRYTLPAHYTHPDSRIKYRIPPTYEAHLSGIPGFQLEVTYAIIVNITRVRDKSDWWRKSTRLRVPFRYRELSRPSNAGPFPVSLTKTPSGPKTLFKFALQSRLRGGQNVNIQVGEEVLQCGSGISKIIFS
ncbi:hypothetical protein PHLCEN_2v7523 [Hermanssonia centrifuga]|uniref:Uncharacterized protein n=1 Tax=Hermanssonia centrifuga TaxID=98765 RepID=A0A2R6NWB6_9APHY|nr:hypothetical protein PHLCEN_2v7523 [Hermanssonia centrifuga]